MKTIAINKIQHTQIRRTFLLAATQIVHKEASWEIGTTKEKGTKQMHTITITMNPWRSPQRIEEAGKTIDSILLPWIGQSYHTP